MALPTKTTLHKDVMPTHKVVISGQLLFHYSIPLLQIQTLIVGQGPTSGPLSVIVELGLPNHNMAELEGSNIREIIRIGYVEI